MQCPNCGAQAAGKFCEYCGSEIPRIAPETVNNDNSHTNITNNYYQLPPQNAQPTTRQVFIPQPLPKIPFWKKNWFIIMVCIFAPYIGVFFLWALKKPLNKKVRIFVTVILIIYSIGIFASSGKDNEENQSVSNAVKSSGTPEESKNVSSAPEEKETPAPTPTKEPEITFEEIKEQAQELNYKDVMRNPENYTGQYFCVTVKISTVESGSLFSGYDKAYKSHTNDEYDWWLGDMIYLLDNRDTENEEYIKILEGDIVKIYGRFDSLVETKNALNGTKGEEMSLQLLYAELISE